MAAPAAVTAAIKAAASILFDSNARKKFFRFIGSLLGGTVMLIVLILCLFIFLISGIIGLLVNSYISDNWNVIKVNITDVFQVLEVSANGEVKNAVYDFMPEFSTNLSKAAISASYPNDLLIYDTAEYEKARGVMESAATTLRAVSDMDGYLDFCREYRVSYIETEYSAVMNDSVFLSDTGIENAAEYSDTVYHILATAADAAMNNYNYTFEEYETDSGKKATRQTLTVTGEDSIQIVEYNAIGEVELYLPEFIALYQVRLLNDTYLSDDEKAAENKDQAIEDTMSEVGDAESEEEFQEAAEKLSSDKISSTLSFMQIADLKGILQKSFSGGGVSASISYENSTDSENRPVSKIIITLEAPYDDEWKDIFEINPDNEGFVAEFQQTIEKILTDAGVAESEFYLSLDNFFQNALFVYFEGFFNLPVESYELVQNSNGIYSKYGDYSSIHRMGVSYTKTFESGVTLAIANTVTEIKVDLLPSVRSKCIEEIVIYDIWDDEYNDKYKSQTMDSVSYGCDIITLAYTINTVQFEKDYGFPFPMPGGVDEVSETITMLVEYSCLSECYYPTMTYQVGDSIKDEIMSGDFSIGLCNDGTNRPSDTHQEYYWYRHFENTSHITIKIAFFNYGGIDRYDTEEETYSGITGSNYGNGYWYQVNPMLWFKGFRTEVDDEILAGLIAA